MIGTLLSLVVFMYARMLAEGRARVRFEGAATGSQQRLDDRLRVCEDLLRGLRGLANAHGNLDRASYRAYLEALDLKGRFPGLLGITYGIPVLPDQRKGVLEWFAKEFPERTPVIHPDWEEGETCIVVLGEPAEANFQALGFNSFSTPEQRASLERARESGEMVASPPMKVAQAPEAGLGLVLRLGVYRMGVPIRTEMERRKAFIGYANAVFLLRDLATGASNRAEEDGLVLQLADITDPAAAIPILAGGAQPQASWWHFLGPRNPETRREFNVGGRVWELRFSAGKDFFQIGEVALPWIITLGGLVVSALLAALVRPISLTGKRARALARQMTEELRRSESRLRAIARIVPDLILVLDAEGRYVEILVQDESQLAAPSGRLLGRKLAEVLPEALAATVLATIRHALEERRIQSLEYSMETLKGSRRFEARVAPMDMEMDGRSCVVWVARDVTEQRAQEEGLRQTQKLESLGLLAGGIAHDFNNLLTAIRGHLSLGIQDVEDGRSPLNHLERMDASIQRAADLAGQLLAYAGRGAFKVEPVDLNILVGEMNELLGVSRSKKVQLDVNLHHPLPRIQGDQVQLQQVVMNLVTNASEAIGDQPGRVELATDVAWLGEDEIEQRMPGQGLRAGIFVTLVVRDDGCGMTPEVRSRIFDPFYSTKPNGRGLGLSAMRGILQAHHAGVEIHSRIGQGTAIQLFFQASEAETLPGQVPIREPKGTLDFSGTILLAEDEQIIRETSRMMAEQMGFQVIEASDGAEAWSLFQTHQDELRLVILDLTMPRHGGAEVYKFIREVRDRMPILLCSGYSQEALPEQKDPWEPRVFLQKPFSLREFESAIRELLSRAQAV